ncbi:hypothetical protein I203_103711 [Kwoniella mangroviensis CBS 8507]|uniref:uncharacterized protein n=1 Tax=Kwoniella mangroviensis CBS 8507 TaxID=1296122 RepID=UPI00080D4505|nr:uncharacterized protein I203_04194 [Kwoniella mangroviensis CBS 8507]OCF66618.1 hypothetical protein I203_04194 [Kwoniella mangroviensis CBS 8507]
MSRPTPRPTYAPDPNGWIDTAPSSSRRMTQRPLISYNHGIATPLSSGYRSARPGPGPTASANIRKRLYEQTPLGQVKDRQGTLNRYLNTPSTMSDKERKLPLSDKDTPVQSHNSVRSGLIFGSKKRNQTDQVAGRGVQGSKLKDRDDFWQDYDTEEDDLQKTAKSMMASQKRGISQRKVVEKEDHVRLPLISQKRSLKKDEVPTAKISKKTIDRPGTPSLRKEKKFEIVGNVIEPSLPPPAQSTRSHDKSSRSQKYGMTGTPAQSTRSHHNNRSPSSTPPRKSPSLPELTPSLSPELETEPTQPRAPSSSPGPFDPLSPPERTPLISKISSPPPPITPIPDWVMNNHRQVNGRNPSQFAAIPSPWRRRDEHPHPPDDEPPQASDGKVKKRKREISKVEEVDRRVLLAAHEKRHKTPSPGNKEKRLVDLSSSDPPSSEPMLEDEEKKAPSEAPSPLRKPSKASGREGRKALTPIKVNALRGTISSSNIGRKPSQRSPITPRRRPRKGPIPVSPLPRTSIMQMQRDQETERERSLSPSPIKTTSKVFPRLSGRSPSPAIGFTNRIDEVEEREQLHAKLNKAENVGRGSEPPHTPRKPSPKRYQLQITPPKARSVRPKLTETQETLFVLPDPPAQPRFATPRRGGRADDGPREWKAAEMVPETLLDWGLEPEYVDTKDGIEAEDNALPEEEAVQVQDERDRVQNQSQTPEPPLFSPGLKDHSPEHGKDRRPSFGHRWSGKSIEPTALSQDFPRLLASSPTSSRDQEASPAHSTPSLAAGRDQDGTDKAIREDPQSDAMKPKPASSSKWDHLHRGILAAGTSQTPNASQKQNKKRKSRSTTDEKAQQSKLASFGFFNDRPNKRMIRDFERKWEDEEDLDIDIPEDDQVIEAGHEEEKGKGKKLDKVPLPPLHPSLRPAGIKELQRRERDRSRSESRGLLDPGITPNRKNTTTTAAAAMTLSSPEPPLFDMRTSSLTSGTGSSQTSWSKTPGSTREWWDKLGNRRTSEFGTME